MKKLDGLYNKANSLDKPELKVKQTMHFCHENDFSSDLNVNFSSGIQLLPQEVYWSSLKQMEIINLQ